MYFSSFQCFVSRLQALLLVVGQILAGLTRVENFPIVVEDSVFVVDKTQPFSVFENLSQNTDQKKLRVFVAI
jgi:hypothetical protein